MPLLNHIGLKAGFLTRAFHGLDQGQCPGTKLLNTTYGAAMRPTNRSLRCAKSSILGWLLQSHNLRHYVVLSLTKLCYDYNGK